MLNGAPAVGAPTDSESESRSVEPVLPQSEQRFYQMFSEAHFGLALVDYQTGLFLEVNDALLNWSGYTRQEFLALNFRTITPSEYLPMELKRNQSLDCSGRFGPYEKEYLRKDGSRFPIRISGFLLVTPEGRKVVWGMIEDITEYAELRRAEHALQECIKKRAFFDLLTNLPNRYLFTDRLRLASINSKRSGRYSALIFLDIDRLKKLNDQHGHAAGDAMLAETASRLCACVRATDTVARFAGDEFVVILSSIHPDLPCATDAAKIVSEKIRGIMSLPFQLNISRSDKPVVAIEFCSSASIGVVLFHGHESDEEMIVKAADDAMYEAKNAGGNRVFFNTLLHQTKRSSDADFERS